MKILSVILLFIIAFNYSRADFNSTIQWWKHKKPVIVYDKQLDILIEKWYSTTRILDIMTLKTNECNNYEWKCIWYNKEWVWVDYWHFQINKIHKEQVKKTLELWEDPKAHFIYQLEYVNLLIDSYEKRFCNADNITAKYWKRSNKERFKCVARVYNGSSFKKSYGEWSWLKREEMKDYIVKYLQNKEK